MIIDQFSAYLQGGAAVAARRLHEALRRHGVASRLWYGRAGAARGLDDSYRRFVRRDGSASMPARLWQAVRRRVNKTRLRWRKQAALRDRPKGLEIFTLPQLGYDTRYAGDARGHDRIVHLHWVADLIDYASWFASIPDHVPIVWTLHDMNPFTGGCHYSGDCRAYADQCRRCPQLGLAGDHDLSSLSFEIKLDALAGKNLHVVTPSRWLLEEARCSRILGGARSHRMIPQGLDTDAFRPIDKTAARRRLGLPEDRILVAFVAESVAKHRKGGQHLLEALNRLTASRIEGLVLGNGHVTLEAGGPRMHRLGFIQEADEIAALYSAADMLILPSLEDNAPLTAVEALACGTPVVGFDVGGIPEYVRHEETGLLAPRGDSAALAQAIARLANHADLRQAMSRRARRQAVQEYHETVHARHYQRLYQSLLDMRGVSVEQAAA